MTPGFAAKFALNLITFNVRNHKIDDSLSIIYGMIVAGLLLQDYQDKVELFEKTFLLATNSMEMILRIFFLPLGNGEIQFRAETLIWIFHIAIKALPKTK